MDTCTPSILDSFQEFKVVLGYRASFKLKTKYSETDCQTPGLVCYLGNALPVMFYSTLFLKQGLI